jgi:hypothetical protein
MWEARTTPGTGAASALAMLFSAGAVHAGIHSHSLAFNMCAWQDLGLTIIEGCHEYPSEFNRSVWAHVAHKHKQGSI